MQKPLKLNFRNLSLHICNERKIIHRLVMLWPNRRAWKRGWDIQQHFMRYFSDPNTPWYFSSSNSFLFTPQIIFVCSILGGVPPRFCDGSQSKAVDVKDIQMATCFARAGTDFVKSSASGRSPSPLDFMLLKVSCTKHLKTSRKGDRWCTILKFHRWH